MSDLNDDNDLLNYELGDDLDDPEDCEADEDELLLSDEETPTEDLNKLKPDAEKWVPEKLEAETTKNPDEVSSTASNYDTVASSQETTDQQSSQSSSRLEADVTTSQELQLPSTQSSTTTTTTTDADEGVSQTQRLAVNDEVSSTYREDSSAVVSTNGRLEEAFASSQESSVLSGTQVSSLDPREDSEEREERMNIKHANERGYEDGPDSSPEKSQGRFMQSKRGRGGALIRGGGVYPGPRPHVRYPSYPSHYPPHPNDPLNNPQNPNAPFGQFDSPMQPPRLPYSPHLAGPRMEYRPMGNPSYRPRTPAEYNMYPPGPRVDFANPNHVNGGGGMYNYQNSNIMRPMYRPDMPMRPRMPIQRPCTPGYLNGPPMVAGAAPTANGQMHLPQAAQLPVIRGPSPTAGPSALPPPVVSSKILINPNFKGGVEAATSQLMKDTQFMHALGNHAQPSDDELLRQQEAFINKNREHIEKRRHERSPPPRPRSRSRSRERSWSPQTQKRDRERRGNSRDRWSNGQRGRFRRGNSPREYDNRHFNKRRRSTSPDSRRKPKSDAEEDEETRAYRIEIEKQKALRERVLRDKEMRRRRAAEEKLQHEDKPSSDDPPPAKLKPIIVTESKIISLKKSSASNDSSSGRQKASKPEPPSKRDQKPSPVAKKEDIKENVELPDDRFDDDEDDLMQELLKDHDTDLLDEEDRLLADTPSPPPPVSAPASSPKPTFATSSNRRVVLKTTSSSSSSSGSKSRHSNHHHEESHSHAHSNSKKGIFDRLDRRIGVDQSAKRKIQRIVIKNAD